MRKLSLSRTKKSLKEEPGSTPPPGHRMMLFADLLLLAVMNHQHLKILDVDLTCVSVRYTCFAKLQEAKWWNKLTNLTMHFSNDKSGIDVHRILDTCKSLRGMFLAF